METQMFIPESSQEYIMAERVTGSVKDGSAVRGRFSKADKFCKWISKNGFDRPVFTNIGRWKPGEEAENKSPVYVPWITVDIDVDGNVFEAKDQARYLTETLMVEGYDLSRVLVSFSGRKGFHIQIASGQVGDPVFKSSICAQNFLKTFTANVGGDIDADPAVCSPHSLIRVSGSKHADTGFYKTTWTGEEFLKLAVQDVYRCAEDPDCNQPFEDPGGSVVRAAREHFGKVYKEAEQRQEEASKEDDGTNKNHGVIDRIRGGVRESEIWGDKYFHVGRENACYVMGCWWLERYSERRALARLKEWNGRNSPPLPERRVESQFEGAKRTINNR
jgi:hypothetical protein